MRKEIDEIDDKSNLTIIDFVLCMLAAIAFCMVISVNIIPGI